MGWMDPTRHRSISTMSPQGVRSLFLMFPKRAAFFGAHLTSHDQVYDILDQLSQAEESLDAVSLPALGCI